MGQTVALLSKRKNEGIGSLCILSKAQKMKARIKAGILSSGVWSHASGPWREHSGRGRYRFDGEARRGPYLLPNLLS